MADITDRLGEVLQRRASDVTPSLLTKHDLRRLRIRQTGLILLASLLVGFVGVGSILTIRGTWPTLADRREVLPAAGNSLEQSVYVVDRRSSTNVSKIHVVQSQPQGSEIVRTFTVGGAATVAATPDNSHLWVASTAGSDANWKDQLVMLNATTGEAEATVDLSQPGSQYRVTDAIIPCCSTMELSPDGRWLFLLQVTPGNEGERTFYVGTFDTRAKKILPESIPLQGCEPGIPAVIPLPGLRRVAVVCENGSDVRFFHASEEGSVATSSRVSLPRGLDPADAPNLGSVAWAAAGDGNRLYVVTLSGHVFIVDHQREILISEHQLALGPNLHVAYGKVFISGDGTTMYLGLGTMDGLDYVSANEVVAVDTATWSVVRRVRAPQEFFSFAAIAVEDSIYATNWEEGTVMVIDMKNGESNLVATEGLTPEQVEGPQR